MCRHVAAQWEPRGQTHPTLRESTRATRAGSWKDRTLFSCLCKVRQFSFILCSFKTAGMKTPVSKQVCLCLFVFPAVPFLFTPLLLLCYAGDSRRKLTCGNNLTYFHVHLHWYLLSLKIKKESCQFSKKENKNKNNRDNN